MKYKTLFLIAEIAQAHQGSFDKALEYIDALSKTGIDAVKFQVHIAEAESSIHEPFRVNMAGGDKTRFDYWKRMEFSLEQWRAIKSHCEAGGMEFIASPFSNAAVDLLERIGVLRYKIGSGEVNNLLMLEKIAATKKPIILSSGMSSYKELDETVAFLKNRGCDFSLLQCTTSYPTQPENYGLNVIAELKMRYQVPVGFSDHSAKIETCIAAVAMGAEILEFHVVFERNNDNGPDSSSSLEIDEITQLVRSVKNISIAMNNPIDKTDNSGFSELKGIFEKSLAVNKSLKKNHKLTFEDLESKKPKGFGIKASEFEAVIGKKLVRDMTQWDFLRHEDLFE
ncbi:N-acetylneuraminate synthase family protein [Aequorivita flava]|uniref:N-acetylneuraminate synthase family protein n=1 Tax=Aequorivita flava TaxID=3114371 RepID=A0AB35YY17_9FLAO